MNAPSEKPFVYWIVTGINRSTKERFRRNLVLDWQTVPPEAESTLRSILASNSTNLDILAFRKCFKDRGDGAFRERDHDLGTSVNGLLQGVQYFEDEAGNPLDEIGWVQIASGVQNPIVFGNPKSVLRLGPSPVKDKADWTVEKANDIAHFLHIVDQIRKCRWHRKDIKITFEGGQLLDFRQADGEDTRSFLLLMRQLLMPVRLDDVLNVACDAYRTHVALRPKADWVEHEQKSFARTRASQPAPFQFGSHTMEEVIDMMIYGAGLAHRKSRDKWDEKLPGILAKYGEERFSFVFHMSCKMLLNYAFSIAPVMNQDFQHWIANQGCSGPTRVLHGCLFDRYGPPATSGA